MQFEELTSGVAGSPGDRIGHRCMPSATLNRGQRQSRAGYSASTT